MNTVFNGHFYAYGFDVLTIALSPNEDRVDPMNRVFPKVTKCIFHKYGGAGRVERHDGLCLLPLNIVNEKIYICLWFWFCGVTVWASIQLTVRIVSLASR